MLSAATRGVQATSYTSGERTIWSPGALPRKCTLLTELAYDGHGCAHHAVPLLQAVGSHGNERVRDGGGEQHCIDGDDLRRGSQETHGSRPS